MAEPENERKNNGSTSKRAELQNEGSNKYQYYKIRHPEKKWHPRK